MPIPGRLVFTRQKDVFGSLPLCRASHRLLTGLNDNSFYPDSVSVIIGQRMAGYRNHNPGSILFCTETLYAGYISLLFDTGQDTFPVNGI